METEESGAERTGERTAERTEDIELWEGQQLGEPLDRGDVIEIPIVEEVLVKKPVVREVVRIRKRTVTESRTVEADVRHEDVEIVEGEDLIDAERDVSIEP